MLKKSYHRGRVFPGGRAQQAEGGGEGKRKEGKRLEQYLLNSENKKSADGLGEHRGRSVVG
jgi:hypothetical protein